MTSNQLVHNPTDHDSAAENGTPLIATLAGGVPNLTPPTLGLVSPEEMLQQMKELIVENYDLKEAMKHNNQAMKDRYEELSAWREKQKAEREFYEFKFKEAKQRLLEVSKENEKLKKNVESFKEQKQGPIQGTHIDTVVSRNQVSEETEQLRTQVTKLQAEKADLLAIISELQLKLNAGSSEDSFVEIRMSAEENGELKANEGLRVETNEVATCMGQSMDEAKNYMESEKLTVSQLLPSLKEETQKVKRLETELQTAMDRLEELKKVAFVSEKETQTDVTTEQEEKEDPKEDSFDSDVEILKLQVKTLRKELQEAHAKLDDAELMKKRLQEKCQQLDRRVSEIEVDFEEKQQLQYAIKKLELQVESMKSESKIEQAKMVHQMSEFTTLQEAFKELQSDLDNSLKTIEDLKIRELERVPKEVMNELNEKLELAEKALAGKQLQIDKMKRTLVSQEEEMETMSLLRAQLDVYCADFHAERLAREKIHQEKEQLAIQLEYMVKENAKLNEDLDNMGRQSLGELQMRHRGPGVPDRSPRIVERGTEQQPHSIPMHACPKCAEILPDLDTLQIHVMDCIT